MEQLYVADGEDAISLLTPYREVMSIEQLERFGEYLLRIRPDKPFTTAEVRLLRLKKDVLVHQRLIPLKLREIHQVVMRCQSSLFESRDLMRRASALTSKLPFELMPAPEMYQQAV